ncbi:MAG: tRNA uridine-5-carboxymethylaminomethyl(34) synthesis GTPase MnmE, partial [Clostridiales Family XIII bacterium]|nr:tRNA uridine-5-carboxymethylaminomethyl(34) synthesis GTPase MnmE [Clostridiales Family XIII bacterium]
MNDTVAAISTPLGTGGIGVIRISGAESREVLERLFRPGKNGDADRDRAAARTALSDRRMAYGRIVDPQSGNAVDEVLAVFMQAPRTYTGEDVAEIHCHGSAPALRRVLALTLREGARLAEPGEFTKRAFLNGRLDLAQAEAVIDLIQAKADTSFDAAIQQLDGSLSHAVKKLRDGLTELLVRVAANLDYPEEDLPPLTAEALVESLSKISDEAEKLLASAHTGRIVREGLRVVITGKPNVGKSSLLNALLREARAIVTEIPGTTRDLIEEGASIRGIPVRLVDTAGIRETTDPVELLGVAGSREAVARSDLALFVLDAGAPFDAEDRRIAACIANRRFIVILNKCDLSPRATVAEASALIASAGADAGAETAAGAEAVASFAVVETSVKEGRGLSAIEDAIEAFVFRGRAPAGDGALVTNLRHADLLEKALAALREGLAAAVRGEAA